MEYSSESPQGAKGNQTLTKIDQTLARSRKVIQQSIQLTKRSASRRSNLDNRMNRSVDQDQSHQEFCRPNPDQMPRPIPNRPDISYYQQKIEQLSKQLENEEYIKKGYQKALKELRDRIFQIQRSQFEGESDQKLKQDLQLQIQQNQYLTQQGIFFQQKIEDLEKQNQLLKEKSLLQPQLVNQDLQKKIQKLKFKLAQKQTQTKEFQQQMQAIQKQKLSWEIQYKKLFSLHSHTEQGRQKPTHKFKHKLGKMKKQITQYQNTIRRFQTSIEDLHKKYEEKITENRELQKQMRYMYDNQTASPSRDFEVVMQRNSVKIKQLEIQLKQTNQKYEELHKRIPMSNSSKGLGARRQSHQFCAVNQENVRTQKRPGLSIRKSFDKKGKKQARVVNTSSFTPKRRYS